MLNYTVVTITLLLLATKHTNSHQQYYEAIQNKPDSSDRAHKNYTEHYREVHNEVIKASKMSAKPNQFYGAYFGNHVYRAIRSNMALNGTAGVERPNPRLSLNGTITSKTGREQVHTFFADKAREDAYQKTEAKEHPYSVVCRIHDQDGSIRICSGTLVTVRWVLTAAHCVADNRAEMFVVYAGIAVNIFDHNHPQSLSSGSQVKTSREFYPHPMYDPTAMNVDYDVALVRIDPGFESTEYVKPIGMTSTPWSHVGYRDCVLTAFGSVRDDRESRDDFIRKTQVLEVRKPCECDRELRANMGSGATGRYICMKPMRDFGFCTGDSGGGLICDGKLTAVVSYSLKISHLGGCKVNARVSRSADGMCGDIDTLNIYQDVYPALAWLKKNALTMNASDTLGDSKAVSQKLRYNHYGLCFILVGLSLGFT